MQIIAGRKEWAKPRIVIGTLGIIIGLVTLDNFGILPLLAGMGSLVWGISGLKK